MQPIKLLEKIFPEFSERIKSIPISIRILGLLILFSIFLSYNIFNFSKIIESSKENIYLVILLIVITIILTILFIYVLKLINKRRLLIKFTKTWREFSSFWFLFHIKVDSYLLQNKELVFEDLNEETEYFRIISYDEEKGSRTCFSNW